MIEDRLVYHNLGLDDYSEYLSNFIPLFGEDVPMFIIDFFSDIKKCFSVGSNGFSGSINETLYDGLKYMEMQGYDTKFVEPYLLLYKGKLQQFLGEK